MDKDKMKQGRVNRKLILSIVFGLGIFSVILVITMGELSKNTKSTVKTGKAKHQTTEVEQPESVAIPYHKELLGVLKAVDYEQQLLIVYDVNGMEEQSFRYSGGTDVRDKYNQVISMTQIPVGSMIDIGYSTPNTKIGKVHISGQAWEYEGSTNFSLYQEDNMITIGKTKYKITEGLVVVNDGALVDLREISSVDELTFRGFDQTIWSIEVTRGHGTVIVVDQEDFLNGTITIGYEAMQTVTENLNMTVREGNFNLNVENGKYKGTKNITVSRNKETYVSLKDLGPGALSKGKVTFEITPFGADLFIDKELISYANAIDLTYGDHEIEVSLGGYVTYQGVLTVDFASKKLTIHLPNKASNQPASVVESEVDITKGSNSGDNGAIIEEEYDQWELPDEDNPEVNNPEVNNPEVNNPEEEDDTTETSNDLEEYEVDGNHYIYVQKPEGASVYLDGDFLGVSPGNFPKVIGLHVLTFIKAGYETKSYTVEIEDDGLDTYLSMPNLIKSGNSSK